MPRKPLDRTAFAQADPRFHRVVRPAGGQARDRARVRAFGPGQDRPQALAQGHGRRGADRQLARPRLPPGRRRAQGDRAARPVGRRQRKRLGGARAMARRDSAAPPARRRARQSAARSASATACSPAPRRKGRGGSPIRSRSSSARPSWCSVWSSRRGRASGCRRSTSASGASLRSASLKDAEVGDLVLCEVSGRPPRVSARVDAVLGDPFAPRSFSADRDPQARPALRIRAGSDRRGAPRRQAAAGRARGPDASADRRHRSRRCARP